MISQFRNVLVSEQGYPGKNTHYAFIRTVPSNCQKNCKRPLEQIYRTEHSVPETFDDDSPNLLDLG